MNRKSYRKCTSTPWGTTTDLSERREEGEGVVGAEGNIDDSVVSESRDRVESSDLLPTTLSTGGDEETGVFPTESTRFPKTTGGVDERFPLGREVSETGRDTKEECIVRFHDAGRDDWVVGLGTSVHLYKNLFGKSLGDSNARTNISTRTIAV